MGDCYQNFKETLTAVLTVFLILCGILWSQQSLTIHSYIAGRVFKVKQPKNQRKFEKITSL